MHSLLWPVQFSSRRRIVLSDWRCSRLFSGDEDVQDIFVEECYRLPSLLRSRPAQQVEPQHGVVQRGDRLMVTLDDDLICRQDFV